MRFEEILRKSERAQPSEAAVRRWRQAVWGPAPAPAWFPNLASGLAMAAMMLLLWPAAARGPVALRAAGEACDGRWEQSVPLRADVRTLARPQPVSPSLAASENCGLCHVR
ncbi:MAG: hypothetical protein K2X03_21375 [Bryobacteraceae bacterium]|nr:hypothetical protein [Bryobacteraceae bacterium]